MQEVTEAVTDVVPPPVPNPSPTSESSSLTYFKDLFTIFGVGFTALGAVVAAATLIKGYREYVQQNRQKRFEYVASRKDKAAKNENFQKIVRLLQAGNDAPVEEWNQITLNDRIEFLTYYEEIALMVNSKFIRREVAHYELGQHLVRGWESDAFWNITVDVGQGRLYFRKDDTRWTVLKNFVNDMSSLDREMRIMDSQEWYLKNRKHLRY
jgi:hypothetical protein